MVAKLLYLTEQRFDRGLSSKKNIMIAIPWRVLVESGGNSKDTVALTQKKR